MSGAALSPCRACGRAVSARAPACPSCGEPGAPIVVEATSKAIKLPFAACVIAACVGVPLAFLGPASTATLGDVLGALGVAGMIVIGVFRWWRHG